MRIPLIGSSNPKGLKLSQGRLINFYVDSSESEVFLAPTPVRKQWSVVGNKDIRGMVEVGEELHVVAGSNYYKVDKNGGSKSIGSLSSTAGRIKMVSNGFGVLIADNGKLFATQDDSLRAVSDLDAPQNVIDVDFADGFYLAVDAETDRFHISETTYDAFNWNALDFAASEFSPDRLCALFTDKSLVWAFNERSIEPFTNTGNPDFPFDPIRSAVSHFGIEAKDSISRVGGGIMWLGRNENGGRVVYELNGGADPVPVSDSSINRFLADATTVSDAFSYSITYRGHDWYCLTLPSYGSHGITLVRDRNTGFWFEWSTDNDSPERQGRFRASQHIYFNGEHLVSDGNIIYELVQGSIHTNIELSLSKEGKSWGNSRSKSLGTLGQNKRVIWRRNGDGRRWSARFRTSSDEVCDGDRRVVRERILSAIQRNDDNMRFNKIWLDAETGTQELVIRGGELS